MRQFFSLIVALSAIFLFVSPSSHSQPSVSLNVDERLIKIVLRDDAADVIFQIDNRGEAQNAQLTAEIIAPNDEIAAVANLQISLTKGANQINSPLEFKNKNTDLALSRLRYRVAANGQKIENVVALTAFAADIFELSAVSSDYAREDFKFPVRVRAFQPATNRGVASVKLSGEFSIEFENNAAPIIVRAKSETDAEGFAFLEFNLPPNLTNVETAKVKISGAKYNLAREIELDSTDFADSNFAYLQTDKPIYQPGQSLRVRTLYFNNNNRAVRDADLTFVVKDPDDQILVKIPQKTSRFGVASFEWQIPENAKLGDYSVRVEAENDLDRNMTMFKVSRYELPNFVVNAKSTAPFYLPTEKSATVEVRADYLFGQPVKRGKVRIARETEREWNFKEQKYDVKEADSREGEFDADGKFTANFDLTKDLKDLDSWDEYEDLNFAAYVTDLTTNKTEQRRFDVRISREPIHVRLIRTGYGGVSRRLPEKYHVSTFYADGTPASCAVKVHVKKDDDDKPILGKMLLKTQTNALGAAKIELPFDGVDEDEDELDIVLSARDANGKTGTKEEDINLEDEPAIRLETDKIVYRQGEPMRIQIQSSEPNAVLFLDVIQNRQIVRAAQIRLQNGRGEVTIPFQSEFQHAVTVAAYFETLNADGDGETVAATKTVIYPKKRGLQIDAALTDKTFLPGADANINLTAKRADGAAGESALGVVVLDKAIEERARTDAEFGGRYHGFYDELAGLLGLDAGFAGIRQTDIDNLDLSKPLAPEIEMAIEIAISSYFRPEFEHSRDFPRALEESFQPRLEKELLPIIGAIKTNFEQNDETPFDRAVFDAVLARQNLALTNFKDAWNKDYLIFFNVERDFAKIRIDSTGADKTWDDDEDALLIDDDFTVTEIRLPYFQPLGSKIDRAFTEFNERTGEFIRDYKTLRAEMQRQSIDLDDLRDAWGEKYRFEFGTERESYFLKIKSGGGNKKFGKPKEDYDDFEIWRSNTDYFAVTRAAMSKALTNRIRENKRFPVDEADFTATLRELGIDLDKLKDAFGRQFYVTKKRGARYSDAIVIRKEKENEIPTVAVKPVTQEIISFAVRSAGADGKRDGEDDFDVARFVGVVSETDKDDARKIRSTGFVSANSGSLSGTVTDENGAVIPDAGIQLTETPITDKSKIYQIRSDEDGFFAFDDLPGDKNYELKVEAVAFKSTLIQNVYVRRDNSIEINVVLEVNGVSQTVSVTSGEVEVSVDSTDTRLQTMVTLNAGVSGVINPKQLINVAGFSADAEESTDKRQIETPRLREYFPETLVWQPELVTDANGKAQLKFKFADSLTTWKMAIVGSTEDGEIGVAEREFQTFQPFFAEHEPPKILTQGDKIALPVVLRNYLSEPQTVAATMTPESWFRLSGDATQTVNVAANNSKNAVFNFEAVESIENGKQKVTAIGSTASDAIEKPVSVHPNGREIVRTNTQIFDEKTAFDIDFPVDALPKTQRAELKIYPNLMAHVVESIEGILRRPYGCGEQTISSAYPSILILKATKNGGDANLKIRASRYLQIGYDRLTGYKATNGGFNYWGRGNGDLALSAYALRFLLDAREFISVDEKLIADTRQFLIKAQNADGSWQNSINTTAYIVKILAQSSDESAKKSVQNALKFLAAENSKIADPHSLANFALAAFAAGDEKTAASIADELGKMAKVEDGGAFWDLQMNTPFNGWGTTGRIETTALVLQVLAKTKSKTQVFKGLQFLLKNKDHYGVWYSTQTTVNVLDALISLLENGAAAAGKTEILIDGSKVAEFETTTDNFNNPQIIDLTRFIQKQKSRVEIRNNGKTLFGSAQIVQNHYVKWQNENGFRANDSNGLKLTVEYDKTNAEIMQEITCRVAVERVGFKGYGMILAEIGLPPGADVSRESLENAVKNSGYNLSRYDILPDKIIVYLWASAGGNRFEFKFKPRYGIDANTAPSTAYDYYNPESNAVVAPTKFAAR